MFLDRVIPLRFPKQTLIPFASTTRSRYFELYLSDTIVESESSSKYFRGDTTMRLFRDAVL